VGVRGTFVLYEPGAGQMLAHDTARSVLPFIPASTFKIPNSLIALETGVVADTLEAFVWDGAQRSIPQWNRDHTLATAFENSVVWACQDVARRIGEERMRDYVARLGYGDEDIGGGIDRFWLTGDLRISAAEQVAFLRRLRERELPVSERTMELVEGMMREESGPGYALHAKTGWAGTDSLDVGWYVGYVLRGDLRSEAAAYFALNLDIAEDADGAARRGIAKAILRERGLIE
jgi:beta-lactamase class D